MDKNFIKAELKGFHYFDYELELFRNIGFILKLKMHFKKNRKVKRYKSYLVVRDPKPIEATKDRIKLVKQLKYQMYGIEIKGIGGN